MKILPLLFRKVVLIAICIFLFLSIWNFARIKEKHKASNYLAQSAIFTTKHFSNSTATVVNFQVIPTEMVDLTATQAMKHKVIQQISPTTIPIPSVILISSSTLHGIGDQLYRYAFSYSTARNLNCTLYLALANNDLALNRTFHSNQRLFVLDQFNIDPSIVFINEELIKSIPKANRLHLNEIGPWKKHELPRNKVIIIEDYWQAEMYWENYKEDIKRQFVLKHISLDAVGRNLLGNIATSESVAVHIRRGDFNGNGLNFRLISISYQIRAMKLMKVTLLRNKTPTFFIFSDDITYAKNALQPKFNSTELVFMPSNSSSLIEFYLMSNCKHFIITNSGFSWWAAYLSNYKDKYVIAPFPRNRQRLYNMFGKKDSFYRKYKEWLYWNKVYPNEWITLNPFERFEDSW